METGKPPKHATGQSKETVREYIHKSFAKLAPLNQDEDLENLKNLLVCLAHALKILSFPSVAKFSDLPNETLDLAIDKLSKGQREHYLAKYGLWSSKPRTLVTLMTFLEHQIAFQQRVISSKRITADQPTSPLCFKCFQSGHTRSQCTNHPFFPN